MLKEQYKNMDCGEMKKIILRGCACNLAPFELPSTIELFHEKTYNATVINEGISIFKSAETVAAGRKLMYRCCFSFLTGKAAPV